MTKTEESKRNICRIKSKVSVGVGNINFSNIETPADPGLPLFADRILAAY